MNMTYVEFLVEEPSMETFLWALLPRLLDEVHFEIRAFQCKDDLLAKLPQRLRGYTWYPEDYRIVIIVDRDDDDCHQLKHTLEQHAISVGLPTRNTSHSFQVFRDAILEFKKGEA